MTREELLQYYREYNATKRPNTSEYHKENYATNKDKILARKKQYYIDNAEKVKAQKRADYLKNVVKNLATKKEYRENNKGKINALSKTYRDNNKEIIKVRKKAYAQNNTDIINVNCARRRANKLNRTPKWATETDAWMIKEIYELAVLRTKLTGVKCHVDHMLPLQGKLVSGLHTPFNMQVIPASQNISKGNRFEL
jgi:hypothetical protein